MTISHPCGTLPETLLDMTRDDRIREFAAAIQGQIVSCPNEQSWEDGECFWISGCSTDLADLLMDQNVPAALADEVVGRLRCPRCDSPFERWQEVGTQYPWEQQHETMVERALEKYGERLFQFNQFLHRFPFLGTTHPFGKKILQEIGKAARTPLHKFEWFRARESKEHDFGPTPAELVGDQRYNSSGQPRWYFSDNPEAAVAEVTKGDTAWVQRFDVGNLEGLLDLRSWRADDDRVLDEEGNYRSPHGLLIVSVVYGDLLTRRHYTGGHESDSQKRKWKPEYLVTRFVADTASRAGFRGILCGSVRYPGENLVVFDPSWCPKPVGEALLVKLDADAMRLRENFFWNQGEPIIVPDNAIIGM
jgi:hypothetical protein